MLLVEGQTDRRVVENLCKRLTLTLKFGIQDKTGFAALAKSIPVELKVPGRVALGIIVDANDDVGARWQSIANQLRTAGIVPPATLDAKGTIIEGTPRVGVWLMPDNQSTGELEDFAARLVPDSDPVWPLAASYIDDIPSEHRKFKPKKKSRAILVAWLATREDPRQIGLAIKTGDLNMSQVPAPDFVAWLTRIFG